MHRTTLGKTGLEVSRIVLGTWQFSGKWGEFEPGTAFKIIRGAFDRGINFFDTAYAYGFGRAERVLGEALAAPLRHNRDDVVIATKGGVRRTDDGTHVRDSSPAFLRHGLEESLRSLNIDHIDILLVHWPDDETPIAETAGCVGEFIAEGTVRFAGVSNYDVAQMEAFSQTTPVSVLQPPYSLLRRGADDEILPYCRERDIGTFVYGTLAHGLLSGKYDADSVFPAEDWRSSSPVFQGDTFTRNVEVAARLRVLAEQMAITLPELVVAWVLHRPGVDCAIVGGRSLDQVEAAAGMSDVRLTDDQLHEIENIAADGVSVGGPSPEASGIE